MAVFAADPVTELDGVDDTDAERLAACCTAIGALLVVPRGDAAGAAAAALAGDGCTAMLPPDVLRAGSLTRREDGLRALRTLRALTMSSRPDRSAYTIGDRPFFFCLFFVFPQWVIH